MVPICFDKSAHKLLVWRGDFSQQMAPSVGIAPLVAWPKQMVPICFDKSAHKLLVWWGDFSQQMAPSVGIAPLVAWPKQMVPICFDKSAHKLLVWWGDFSQQMAPSVGIAPLVAWPKQMVPICFDKSAHKLLVWWGDFSQQMAPSVGIAPLVSETVLEAVTLSLHPNGIRGDSRISGYLLFKHDPNMRSTMVRARSDGLFDETHRRRPRLPHDKSAILSTHKPLTSPKLRRFA
ncbi:hypothetical protein [Nitratireductor soli]|uniref:hypothetical protein n=1 Tax=Nitratireductor soli TaxID=1670619 RepID=UPI00065E64EA|nr:hypothetical protein [Nitratireductor soli]